MTESTTAPGEHRHDHLPSPPPPAWIPWGLAGVLAFAVFAFGAVEDWSSATVEVALFAMAALAVGRGTASLALPRGLKAPALVVAVLAVAGLLQLVPLKASWWTALGDERGTLMTRAAQAETLLHSDLYRTDPITQEVLPPDPPETQTPPAPAWIPATFTPVLTARAVVALGAAGALLLLLGPLATGGGRHALRFLAGVTGALAIGVGVVALAQFRPGAQKVLGLRESAHAGGAFGPFINENNGMGFVNLGLGCLYYLLWRRADRERRVSNRLGIGALFLALMGFHAALLAIRTSVAGFWPLLIAPACLLIHAVRRNRRLAAGLAVGLAVSLLLLSVVAVAGHFTDLHGRLGVWGDALAQPHLLAGNGLQSFGERFQAVLRDLPSRKAVWWIYPENEYLQLVFEAGFLGAAAAVLALGTVLSLGWRALTSAGHTFVLVPFLWGEALHAFTDFHFHLWPVAMAYLVVVALMETALLRANHNGTEGARRSHEHRKASSS